MSLITVQNLANGCFRSQTSRSRGGCDVSPVAMFISVVAWVSGDYNDAVRIFRPIVALSWWVEWCDPSQKCSHVLRTLFILLFIINYLSFILVEWCDPSQKCSHLLRTLFPTISYFLPQSMFKLFQLWLYMTCNYILYIHIAYIQSQ